MNKQEMIVNAIETHISALYRDVENYTRSGNKEAIIDCYNEIRKYNELKKETIQ